MTSVAVIGAGRVGCALARGLHQAGHRVIAVSDADPAAASALAGRLDSQAGPNSAAVRAQLILLAVPDRLIAPVATELADTCPAGPQVADAAVVHPSGALDESVLTPLAERGWATGAWHPLQAFASTSALLLPGITWAVTAAEPLAGQLDQLSRELGGHPIRVPADAKSTYHAAAALAANYTVTLTAHAADLLRNCGLSRAEAVQALVPLLRSTVDALAASGLPDGLTGPLVRGDLETVAGHLATLGDHPETAALYRAAGLATLTLLTERGVPAETIRRAEEVLRRSGAHGPV